jgi:hypothetical protein
MEIIGQPSCRCGMKAVLISCGEEEPFDQPDAEE